MAPANRLMSAKQKSKIDNNKQTSPYWLKALAGFLLVFLVFQVFKSNVGYQWIFNLVKQNLETKERYPDISIDQKWESKLGFAYKYTTYIKQNTPDSAFVLFPHRDSIKADKNLHPHFVASDNWKDYFLYPRKALSVSDPTYDSVFAPSSFTHLAIVSKQGYHLLPSAIDTSKAPVYTVIKLKN